MIDKDNAGRAAGSILRRRGIALSSYGIERFLFARRLLSAEPRMSRHPTLAECATKAKVGLRTLTRCLRGERVDRRSIELIFLGVGLELEPQDVASNHVAAPTYLPPTEKPISKSCTADSYA